MRKKGRRKKRQLIKSHHPNVARDEKRFCVGREERHPLPRASLFLVLGVDPRPLFAHLGHTTKGLRVVYKGLVESLGQGRIGDVCRAVGRFHKRGHTIMVSGLAYRRVWGLCHRW